MAKGRAYNPLLKSYPDSERINAVSEGAEILYVRLLAQSDDAGRYSADPVWVLAKLFTHRMAQSELKPSDIEERLSELASKGLVRIYEVNGRRYLEMPDVFKTLRTDVKPQHTWPEPVSGYVTNPLRTRAESVTDTGRTRAGHGPLDQTRPTPDPDQATDPDSCSEQASPATEPDSPVVMEFPCSGKVASWQLRQAYIDQLGEWFPGIDAEAACRRALGWAVSNPKKRKTAAGMTRFLYSWCEKDSNDGKRPLIDSARNQSRQGGSGTRPAPNAVARGQRFVPTDRP